MLERIREGSQGTWAVVILGLVILSFVFAGVGGYISSSGEIAAAEVNGEEISKATLDRAYENERARIESREGGEAFGALLANADYLAQFRQSILDRLIGDKLVEQAAADLGLRVSNEQVRAQVISMQEFQIGGQFNNQRFKALIQQAGFQPASFREFMRKEMTRQQVSQALLGSEFALNSEAKTVYGLQAQTRNLKYLIVSAESFKADTQISDEEITAYYQKNLAQFDTPEKVSLSYVELSLSDLLPGISVTEQELKDAYEQNKGDYRTEEERSVSHILVEFGDDRDAAMAKIVAAKASLEDGQDFADVAKAVSEDAFSAENGGDLGIITLNAYEPSFEQAVFALQNVGDVSDIVESESGFHLIKLTRLKAPEVTPFEDVRDALTAKVKNDKAIETFYTIHQHMAEVAFEMPDSLVEVAAAANKPVQTTDLFTRNTAPAPFNNGEVLTSAFSAELIQDKLNSEVLELGDNHVIVMRVAEHQPERTKALDEVKDAIVAQLSADKAQQAAMQWTQDTLTGLQAGEDITARLSEKSLSWIEQSDVPRFGSTIPGALVEKAFQLSTSATENKAVVELASGDAGIVELTAVNEPEAAPEEQLTRMQQGLADYNSQNVYTSLIEALKTDADITIYKL